MPSKKQKPEAAKTELKAKADKAPTVNQQGIPLGRPAFGANVTPMAADPLAPAGAVQLQTSNEKERKAGSPTVTLMNPTPTAAAKTVNPVKRG